MHCRLIDCYKTTEDDGYRQTTPIVHLLVRDQSFQRHHLRVEGFRPYFCVRQSEWVDLGEEVAADDRVLRVEAEDVRGRPEEAIDGEPLVRVVCRTPSDVDDLRELFDDPFEADVQYPVRFLVDHGVFQWIEVPDSAVQGNTPIDVSEVSVGVEESEVPDETPPPRVCVYDIEVRQGGSGPPVVSEEGTEQANNPITAITAHDSYTDEYRVWALKHDDWGVEESQTARGAVDADVSVYGNPRDVAALFCEYLKERDFDIWTGWNAASFDHPYFVNYCLTNNIRSVKQLSPTGDVYDMNGDGNWINSSLKGRMLVDLLAMYKKCMVHSLDSYRLADVAEAEDVSVGKLDLEDEISVPDGEPAIDYAWREHPEAFIEYSLRDTMAAVAINKESQQDVSIL